MKLRGSKPGYRCAHVAEGPSPAGIVLLLCLYLLGAVVGCYFARGSAGPGIEPEEWVNLCACIDGVLIALILLLSWMRMYPLLPMILMILKGFLTSAWVMWCCADGAMAGYVRACGEWGIFSTVSLLCALIAALKGLSVHYRGGRRARQVRTSLILMGVLYAFLLMGTMLQTQICKWL